jgi:hypothetical protein
MYLFKRTMFTHYTIPYANYAKTINSRRRVHARGRANNSFFTLIKFHIVWLGRKTVFPLGAIVMYKILRGPSKMLTICYWTYFNDYEKIYVLDTDIFWF